MTVTPETLTGEMIREECSPGSPRFEDGDCALRYRLTGRYHWGEVISESANQRARQRICDAINARRTKGVSDGE